MPCFLQDKSPFIAVKCKKLLILLLIVKLLTFCEFTLLGIVGVIGLIMSKERDLLTNNVMKKILLSAVTLIGANVVMMLLLRDYDVTKVVSVRQILSIILTLVIAYFYFNEKITKENMIGIILGIVSIYFISN